MKMASEQGSWLYPYHAHSRACAFSWLYAGHVHQLDLRRGQLRTKWSVRGWIPLCAKLTWAVCPVFFAVRHKHVQAAIFADGHRYLGQYAWLSLCQVRWLAHVLCVLQQQQPGSSSEVRVAGVICQNHTVTHTNSIPTPCIAAAARRLDVLHNVEHTITCAIITEKHWITGQRHCMASTTFRNVHLKMEWRYAVVEPARTITSRTAGLPPEPGFPHWMYTPPCIRTICRLIGTKAPRSLTHWGRMHSWCSPDWPCVPQPGGMQPARVA